MGKGQKLLCVTPFFLRETKVVLLTMGEMNVLALRGEKPKSQNDRQMKQGRLSSITQRYNIFWFIHEKKQIMCASLPHCTHTFWISTEEKKKSQTNNFFFCLMLCRLSKWWCYVVLTCSDGPLNFIKRSSLKEFLSCVMIQWQVMIKGSPLPQKSVWIPPACSGGNYAMIWMQEFQPGSRVKAHLIHRLRTNFVPFLPEI